MKNCVHCGTGLILLHLESSILNYVYFTLILYYILPKSRNDFIIVV